MKKAFLTITTVCIVLALSISFIMSTPIKAQTTEELYLVDTVGVSDGISIIFSVELDPVTHRANLQFLPDVGYGPGAVPLNSVASLACTPDGDRLYCIDWDNGSYGSPRSSGLGYIDLSVAPPTWNFVGAVTGVGANPPDIVQAAFSTEGELYIVSQSNDSLYLLNTSSAIAILVGNIKNVATDAQLDVGGADIVFGEDGTFYLWTNNSATDAPRGLYTLTLPGTWPGTVNASHVGTGSTGAYFTGLAIRDNGEGELVGSETENDSIWVIDKSDSLTPTGEKYVMYESGLPYVYTYGDMTVGQLGEDDYIPPPEEDEECDDEAVGGEVFQIDKKAMMLRLVGLVVIFVLTIGGGVIAVGRYRIR
ncbi:hypothetical protein ACFLX4_03015 [Chloroflexota bacterium]